MPRHPLGSLRLRSFPVRVDDTEARQHFAFQGPVEVLGVAGACRGTYWDRPRRDGRVRAEARGLFATPEGDLRWAASALGEPQPDHRTVWRAIFLFDPAPGRLAALSDAPVLSELEQHHDGRVRGDLMPWEPWTDEPEPAPWTRRARGGGRP